MNRLKNVQIQTQGACNANCVFCPWIESWHHANYGVMDRELFSRILDMLLPWKESIEDGGKICPYLMQEPFVDKRIFELCEEIQSKFPRAVLELSTNGALLSRDKTERLIPLLEGKPHEVWVSHHGIDKASHEEIMKINHERSTSHLINLIKEAKGRLNIRIRGS
jgi:MoaA/NifB/PqqE/SkfB family radical SAM enzyme